MATRRIAPVLLAALLTAGVAGPAYAGAADARAITVAAATLPPNRFLWTPAASGPGRVSVLISVPDQRAYVFRGEQLVAASSVSTGSDERPTPLGTFTILQKEQDHRSNLYDDAPMPYMQRLTWDGVAMHAGRNPGFPASHGCIRLPTGFARKLFEATKLGATVEVTADAYVAGAYVRSGEAGQAARANDYASR